MLRMTDRDRPATFSLTAEDLGLTAEELPREGYRLLKDEPTSGRFPTGMAVAQLIAARHSWDSEAYPRLAELGGEEAVGWNELTDDLPLVREVLLSGSHAASPDRPTLDDYIRTAATVGCSMLLAYTQCGDPAYDATLSGVLIDTSNGAPLASFRAAACVTPEEYEACIEIEPQDERWCRAEFLARRDFTRYVRLALEDLMHRDSPAAATQPSPWLTDRPLYPRDHRRRYGPKRD